jgi:hypothetical protein
MAWPQVLRIHKVWALARARLQPGPVQDAATVAHDTQLLGQTFLQCYATATNSLVELWVRPPRVSPASSFPVEKSVMPKGVEHAPHSSAVRVPSRSGEVSDAERR